MEDEVRRRLPPEVYDLALRLGANLHAGRDVALRQTGRMRQDPASSWMKFNARQTISSYACAFEWRASTGPLGMVSVRDALSGGEGALDVRALSFIKIAHLAPSPALTRGELMRYLAEVAWAPDAILFNTALRWRSDGPDRLIVNGRRRRRSRDLGHARQRRTHRERLRRRPSARRKGHIHADALGRAVHRLSPASWFLAAILRRSQLDRRRGPLRLLGRPHRSLGGA